MEQADVEGCRDQRLRGFARDFFVGANEADLVRPLCLLLDFLRVEEDQDLLAEGASVSDTQLEGAGGDLELLHPCIEIPSLKKYQALFDPSPAADEIPEGCRRELQPCRG